VLLLCTDGLTEMVPEQRIVEILQSAREPRQICERLIVEANERGGKDNVTVIVVNLKE
jgi:protein phosphatase